MAICYISYALHMSIKHEALGMWTPPDGVDIERWLELWLKNGKTFKVSPGSIYALPLVNRSGNPQIGVLLQALEKKIELIYKLGSVPYRIDSADMRSGKAQLMAHAELRAYISDKTTFLARQWEAFVTKYLEIL